MDRKFFILSLFVFGIVIINGEFNERNDNFVIDKVGTFEEEWSEENRPVETLHFPDQLTDADKSTTKNTDLKNRNADTITNSDVITRGQVVFATSEAQINSKRDKSDKYVQSELDQYPIGQWRRPSLVIDVSSDSKLLATPGTNLLIKFQVTNYGEFGMYHRFWVENTKLQFPEIRGPSEGYIESGQTADVYVTFFVPDNFNSNDEIIDTVKLYARRNFDYVGAPAEKSVFIYSRNALKNKKSTNPTIEYEFYDNCHGKTRKERCEYSQWSVEITVTNEDSGLKQVSSNPVGILPKRGVIFRAGTKDPVTFIYSASCCHKSVDIKTIDIFDNSLSKTIDVTEWDNLSDGEIVAIVIGVLFLLLLLIIMIILCARCIKKHKAADLSYTQRYGSRPPA